MGRWADFSTSARHDKSKVAEGVAWMSAQKPHGANGKPNRIPAREVHHSGILPADPPSERPGMRWPHFDAAAGRHAEGTPGAGKHAKAGGPPGPTPPLKKLPGM